MAGEQILTLTEGNFDEHLLGDARPILVDFWASWCQPCKVIAPSLEQIAEELTGRAVVGKVDVDQNGSLAVRFGIRSIPTLVVFKAGKVVDQMVGAHSKDQIRELIDRHI